MKDSAYHLPAVAILMMVIFSGCASSTALIRDPALLVKDPGSLVGHPRIEKNVAHVVALWEPPQVKASTIRTHEASPAKSCFSALAAKQVARIHGTVNIYEYDNYDANSDDDPELLHTFAFDPEAWEVHRGLGRLVIRTAFLFRT